VEKTTCRLFSRNELWDGKMSIHKNLLSIFKVTIAPQETDYDPQWTLWKSRLDADAVR